MNERKLKREINAIVAESIPDNYTICITAFWDDYYNRVRITVEKCEPVLDMYNEPDECIFCHIVYERGTPEVDSIILKEVHNECSLDEVVDFLLLFGDCRIVFEYLGPEFTYEYTEEDDEDDISILLEDGKDETEKMIENVLENTIQNYIDEYGYIEAKSEWDGKIVRVKIELYGYETKVSDYNHTVYDAPILKIRASEQNSADGVIVHSLKTIQECVALLMSVPTDWYDFYIHEDNVLEKIYWMTGDSYYEDESGKLQPLLLEPLYDSDDDDLPF